MNNDSLLHRGVAEIIDATHLEKRLASGGVLRVKLGVDPSRPDLHIGHALTLRKLRAFQEAGHIAVLIIGDYTAQIGDPTDRSEARKVLSAEEVKKNAEGYLDQVFKILDKDKTEVHFQTEWFNAFTLLSVIELMSTTTINHILSHDTFGRRIAEGNPLHAHEILYPLLQGFDSVAIKSDIELGGIDQKFNVLMGRVVQRAHGMPEQDVMLLEYLPGIDGQAKMSKSLDNTINLTDTPEDMFGKIMSIPDSLILPYFKLATVVSDEKVKEYETELAQPETNPRNIKVALAKTIVSEILSDEAATKAAEEFDRVFRDKQLPENMETLVLKPVNHELVDILVNRSSLASSKSEARRLVAQGGVRVNGVVVQDSTEEVVPNSDGETIIQVGPRRFLKIEWKQ